MGFFEVIVYFLLCTQMIIVSAIVYIRSFKSTHYLASFRFFNPAIIPFSNLLIIVYVGGAKIWRYEKIEHATVFIILFDLHIASILAILLRAKTKLKHFHLVDPEIKGKCLNSAPPEEREWWHSLDWNRDPWIVVSDTGIQTSLNSTASRVVAPKTTTRSGKTQRPTTDAENLHPLRSNSSSQIRSRSLDTRPQAEVGGMNKAGRRRYSEREPSNGEDGEDNVITPLNSQKTIPRSAKTQVPASNTPMTDKQKVMARIAWLNDHPEAVDRRLFQRKPGWPADAGMEEDDAATTNLKSQRNVDETVLRDHRAKNPGQSTGVHFGDDDSTVRERGCEEPRQSTKAFFEANGFAVQKRGDGNTRRYTEADFMERGCFDQKWEPSSPTWSTTGDVNDGDGPSVQEKKAMLNGRR